MVLADRSTDNLRNGRRSRGPSPNGHGGSPESSSDDENSSKKIGGSKSGKKSTEYEAEKIRVGRDYQAVCPDLVPAVERKPEQMNDRALLVWSPTKEIPDMKLEEYISVAKEKYGYNGEQALGMLFWHKHDLERAVLDLANFTPFPDEWTVEDKVLFDQAFQFHGKSFHRIRQMLPDKTIASLVKYYYSWKKSRTRTSVMDRQEKIKKNEGSENGSENGSNEDSDNEEKKWPIHRGIRRESGSPPRGTCDDPNTNSAAPANQAFSSSVMVAGQNINSSTMSSLLVNNHSVAFSGQMMIGDINAIATNQSLHQQTSQQQQQHSSGATSSATSSLASLSAGTVATINSGMNANQTVAQNNNGQSQSLNGNVQGIGVGGIAGGGSGGSSSSTSGGTSLINNSNNKMRSKELAIIKVTTNPHHYRGGSGGGSGVIGGGSSSDVGGLMMNTTSGNNNSASQQMMSATAASLVVASSPCSSSTGGGTVSTILNTPTGASASGGGGGGGICGISTGCAGCGVPCNHVNNTPQGKLCNSCYHHWRRTGNLRPTSGPTCLGKRLRGNSSIANEKHKRKPPRGMHINHDDIVALATTAAATQTATATKSSSGVSGGGGGGGVGGGNAIQTPIAGDAILNEQSTSGTGNIAVDGKLRSDDLLASMDRKIISLWCQIQQNKQTASSMKRKNSDASDELRPQENSNRINSRWNSEELLLAVQGVKKYGKDFQAIAEAIGTKTEAQIRTFFVNYRRKYNLDVALKEYEADNALQHNKQLPQQHSIQSTQLIQAPQPANNTIGTTEIMEIDFDEDSTGIAKKEKDTADIKTIDDSEISLTDATVESGKSVTIVPVPVVTTAATVAATAVAAAAAAATVQQQIESATSVTSTKTIAAK